MVAQKIALLFSRGFTYD